MADLLPEEALTKEDCIRIAAECFEDPVQFCIKFLPDLFPPEPGKLPEIPWMQRGLLAILTGRVAFLEKYGEVDKIISNFVLIEEEYDHVTQETATRVVGEIFYRDAQGALRMNLSQHLLIIIPRGYSKTTLAGVAVPLYNTLYQEVQFTLYVSHAEDHATMQLDNVKRQLEGNPRIIAVFGNLKPSRTDPEHWSTRLFETTTGTVAAARGSGGQVRGLMHNGKRPQVVIVDDLEDREEVKSETQRKNTKSWFMGDLKPVLPKMDSHARIVVLGTLTHPDCLLQHLKSDPQWSTVQMGIYDREGDLLWARNMDEKKIASEEASFAAMGELEQFYLEYHSRIMTPETQLFKQEYFQYGIPEERIIGMTLAMDPAISEKRTADDTVLALVAFTIRGNIVVLDMWGERTADEELKLNMYFATITRWNMLGYANRHGIESNAYQAALANAARRQMFSRGMFFEIDPLIGKTNKVSRIKGTLYGPHRSGHLWFARRFPKLEQQLILFRNDGSHKHDDWPDAVAMAVKLGEDFAAFASPTMDLTSGEDKSLIPLEDILEGGFQWAS